MSFTQNQFEIVFISDSRLELLSLRLLFVYLCQPDPQDALVI